MTKMTKTQIVATLAEKTGLAKKHVKAVFEALGTLAKKELGKKGSGEFSILPGVVKARIRIRAAIPAGKWMNPFTKKEEIRKAKPARRVVRLTALKVLKDAVL